uniref:Alpha/beta hydrolase fold-3 domain-containing protein n=1 Tax=Leersia perrieri TaxID=77586 RepID=A0A0D9WZP0_9ORYZ
MNSVVGDVAVDLHPFMRKYTDGRIERMLFSSFVPASEDPAASRGVATRDVIIDETNGVSARLFLPSDAAASDNGRRRRLPVVVYIHGGSFCTESAFCRTYHRYATSVASRAGALVVSVEYRLAPEHPVPAAHDDAWAALRWAASPLSDPWLTEHADLTRLFVAGDSAGGHIAYRTAVRASHDGIHIEGLIVVQPFFWGAEMLPSEVAWVGDSVIDPHRVGDLWPFVTAGQAGNDDPWLEPSVEEIAGLTFRRALVAVAEKDFLRHRGLHLAARMRWAGGREVTVVDSEGEDHGFHLYSPLRATSRRLMESIVQFINHRSESETASGWPAGVLPELHECAPLRACKGKVSRAQPLLSVPSRPYQAVFLNGFDLQARHGPRAVEMNSSLTIGPRKTSKRGFGLFTARSKANNCSASMVTLSATTSVSSITVGKKFF